MGTVIEVDFLKERVNRCPAVKAVEAAVPRARDLAMVADAFRTAMNAHAKDQEVGTVDGLRAACERIGVTAPLFMFERVVRAVRLSERDLPAGASALQRSHAARNTALQLGYMSIEAGLAAGVAGPSNEVADELLRSMP